MLSKCLGQDGPLKHGETVSPKKGRFAPSGHFIEQVADNLAPIDREFMPVRQLHTAPSWSVVAQAIQ